MDPNSITAVLSTLAPDAYGWRANLPNQAGTFFGCSVHIRFQTRQTPLRELPPRPNFAELELAAHILTELGTILVISERAYSERNARWNKDPATTVREPHIWIDRDAIEEDGPTRWAFVIGEQGSPDYGTHVEFDGTDFIECWGGD